MNTTSTRKMSHPNAIRAIKRIVKEVAYIRMKKPKLNLRQHFALSAIAYNLERIMDEEKNEISKYNAERGRNMVNNKRGKAKNKRRKS